MVRLGRTGLSNHRKGSLLRNLQPQIQVINSMSAPAWRQKFSSRASLIHDLNMRRFGNPPFETRSLLLKLDRTPPLRNVHPTVLLGPTVVGLRRRPQSLQMIPRF